MTDREVARVFNDCERWQLCAPERSEREQYSEKVRVPLYQLNDGTVAPGSPFAQRHHTQLLGGGKKWMTTTVRIRLWKLVRFFGGTTFPLTYKTIAAGGARGSPSSRKTKNKQK